MTPEQIDRLQAENEKLSNDLESTRRALELESSDNERNCAEKERFKAFALEAEKKANELSVKLARAVEALRPFAVISSDGRFADFDEAYLVVEIPPKSEGDVMLSDLRRAAAVLAEIGGGK